VIPEEDKESNEPQQPLLKQINAVNSSEEENSGGSLIDNKCRV
jgi:hypothetical protein